MPLSLSLNVSMSPAPLSIGRPPLLNAALFKPNVQREIRRVFAENFVVYGARKVWRRLRREASPLPAAPWSG